MEQVMVMLHLEWLSVRKNHITSLPIAIGDLTDLTDLLVDDNELTYISPVHGDQQQWIIVPDFHV